MSTFYYWVGFVVIWLLIAAASAVTIFGLLSALWIYGVAKINTTKIPWLLWVAHYVRRFFGKYNYSPTNLQPPFLYNREGWRDKTKSEIPTVRLLQANIIRYNRRRWARIAQGKK